MAFIPFGIVVSLRFNRFVPLDFTPSVPRTQPNTSSMAGPSETYPFANLNRLAGLDDSTT